MHFLKFGYAIAKGDLVIQDAKKIMVLVLVVPAVLLFAITAVV